MSSVHHVVWRVQVQVQDQCPMCSVSNWVSLKEAWKVSLLWTLIFCWSLNGLKLLQLFFAGHPLSSMVSQQAYNSQGLTRSVTWPTQLLKPKKKYCSQEKLNLSLCANRRTNINKPKHLGKKFGHVSRVKCLLLPFIWPPNYTASAAIKVPGRFGYAVALTFVKKGAQ